MAVSKKRVEAPDHEPLEPHQLALIFPALGGDTFRKLVEDIREHGLLQPIHVFEGKTLDGVHREKACIAAQVSRRYVQFKRTFDEALSFVWSMNGHRRHLDAEQLSAAAVRVERLRAERGAPKRTAEHLAKEIGVHPHTASNAQLIVEEGAPELVAAAESGKISVTRAASLIDLPLSSQQQIVRGDDRIPLSRRVHIEQMRRLEKGEDIMPPPIRVGGAASFGHGALLKHAAPLRNVRHEAFAHAIAKGKRLSTAYRAAGYKASANSLHQGSSRLLARPDVAGRIAQLRSDSFEIDYEPRQDILGYLIGQGAGGVPLSKLTIGEVPNLIKAASCDLIILRWIKEHYGSSDASAQVKNLIKISELNKLIDRAKRDSDQSA
jgi:ParB-like chromosome segregation protein Spo0J